MSAVKEMLLLVADAILFLFGLYALISFLSNADAITKRVNREIVSKSNIGQTIAEEIYGGYNENGNIKYDGVIEGVQLVADLQQINQDKEIVLIPHGGNKIILTNEVIEDKPLLQYAKEVDSSILPREYIDTESTYTRYYSLSEDGVVDKVVFRQDY